MKENGNSEKNTKGVKSLKSCKSNQFIRHTHHIYKSKNVHCVGL